MAAGLLRALRSVTVAATTAVAAVLLMGASVTAALPSGADATLRYIEALRGKVGPSYGRRYMLRTDAVAAVKALGEKESFWVRTPSDGLVKQEATLTAAGAHSLVYSSDGVDNRLARDVMAEFDKVIYPGVRRLFGQEPYPGIDGDGRVTILLVDQPDLSEGYFDPINQYRMRYSNMREMVVVNVRGLEPVRLFAALAHEFQHLVHYGADPTEEIWLTEGMSQYAELYLYGQRNHLDDFARHPSTSLVEWSGSSASYGAALSFVAYLAGRYSTGGVLADLVSEGLDGSAGVDAYLKRSYGTTFDAVFDDWTTANLTADSLGLGLQPESGTAVFLPPWSAAYVGGVVGGSRVSLTVESPSDKLSVTAVMWHDGSPPALAKLPAARDAGGVWTAELPGDADTEVTLIFRARGRAAAKDIAEPGVDYGKTAAAAVVAIGMGMALARR